MKKTAHIIFISVILVEIILGLIFYFPLGSSCGSACDPHSLFNPFGYSKVETEVCIQVCAHTPHPAFYLIVHSMLLTIASYVVYLIILKIPLAIKNRKILYVFLLVILSLIIIFALYSLFFWIYNFLMALPNKFL